MNAVELVQGVREKLLHEHGWVGNDSVAQAYANGVKETARRLETALDGCIVLTAEEAEHARGCINALRYVPKARAMPAADEVIALSGVDDA